MSANPSLHTITIRSIKYAGDEPPRQHFLQNRYCIRHNSTRAKALALGGSVSPWVWVTDFPAHCFAHLLLLICVHLYASYCERHFPYGFSLPAGGARQSRLHDVFLVRSGRVCSYSHETRPGRVVLGWR